MPKPGHPWQFNSAALERMQREMREMEKAAAQARHLDVACERMSDAISKVGKISRDNITKVKI